MSPCLASNDLVGRPLAYAEAGAQDRQGKAVFGPGASEFKNLAFRKFRSRGVLSTPHALGMLPKVVRVAPACATLSVSIGYVVGLGSKKEVLWADAPSIVAFVANETSLSDLAEVEPPRDSVGQGLPTAEAHNAVLARTRLPDPCPTLPDRGAVLGHVAITRHICPEPHHVVERHFGHAPSLPVSVGGIHV